MFQMFLVFLLCFFLLTIVLSNEIKKNSSFFLIVASSSTTVTSIISWLVVLSQKTLPSTMSPLIYLNIGFIILSVIVWMFSKDNLETDKSSFLVDLVGAWNKIDIDNSIDNIVQYAIKNPSDREWATEVLRILKGFKEDKKIIDNTPPSVIKEEESMSK